MALKRKTDSDREKITGGKTRGFTKIDNELIRCPGIGYTPFRLIAFLKSFSEGRCYPSRRVITRDTGMSDATISKALSELQQYNMLSYIRGSDQRSNRYTIKPEDEWKLPQKLTSSKNKVALAAEDELPNFQIATGSDSDETPPQNLKRNKNKPNNTKDTKTKDQDEIGNSKSVFDSLPDKSKIFFAEDLIECYRSCCWRHFKKRYDVEYESQVHDEGLLGNIFSIYFDLLQIGGSLHGWVNNEFVRLAKKKTRHLPRPEFLLNTDSLKSYKSALYEEFDLGEELSDAFKGLPTDQFQQPIDEDDVYQKCAATVRSFMESGDVIATELLRIESGDRSVFSLSINVLWYLVIKENLGLGAYETRTTDALRCFGQAIGAEIELPGYGQEFILRRGNTAVHFTERVLYRPVTELQ